MGWKDILRPIRDGLRDRLPSKPEDPEEARERLKQQRQDAVKGFTYFDSFEQVLGWKPVDVDPIQKANTPLLKRPPAINQTDTARILLCHDYKGNYQDYESNHGSKIDKEVYACNYMQYVDTFVYFSHKLVCVSPPTWTNTLHRNGVKVLGTLLIERQTGDRDNLLREERPGEFPVARQLAAMARCYGFDGWLINIEGTFSKGTWSLERMLGFISHLRAAIGKEDILIWYDALTMSNEVHYQNSLTHQNLPFAKAAEALFINYEWNLDKVCNAKTLGTKSSLRLENLSFGVDVWAQNTQHGTHRRVTYPAKGGGGTNTGLAVARLAEMGFGAGIFGPAWCYEHFEQNARQVERSMWDGYQLPDEIECSCGDARPHHTADYMQNPITRHARRYPAGSKKFFYTDFNQHIRDGRSQLSSQSVLPHLKRATSPDCCSEYLKGQLHDEPPCLAVCLHENETDDARDSLEQSPPLQRRPLHIFDLDMPVTEAVQMRVRYQHCVTADQVPELSLEFQRQGKSWRRPLILDRRQHLLTFEFTDEVLGEPSRRYSTSQPSGSSEDDVRLTGIGIAYHGRSASIDFDIVRIFEICIQPTHEPDIPWIVGNIRLEHKGAEDTAHHRLMWEYRCGQCAGVEELLEGWQRSGRPYSHTTGPFAHFVISVDCQKIGKAYATEYVLPAAAVEMIRRSTVVAVDIMGIGFGGRIISRSAASVRLPDEGWELV